MKFLQVWCSSPCFQLRGQDTSTALCFRPPNPLAWRRWEVASRRFEDTVTWEKPFTFSVSISLRSALKDKTENNCYQGVENKDSFSLRPHLFSVIKHIRMSKHTFLSASAFLIHAERPQIFIQCNAGFSAFTLQWLWLQVTFTAYFEKRGHKCWFEMSLNTFLVSGPWKKF